MKNIILSLAFIMLAVVSYGQTAAGRTAKTKISDGLALLPAPNAAEYNRIMEDFVSTGAEGANVLTAMFTSTNNVPVRYALAGWSAYVSKGNEAARKTFADAVVKALDKSTDPEVKTFYISLLRQMGADKGIDDVSLHAAETVVASKPVPPSKTARLAESVRVKGKAAMPQILKALNDKDRAYRNAALYMTEPFAGDDVYEMVFSKLAKAPAATKVDIINYLGRHRYVKALPAIIQYIGNEDNDLNTSAMWASTAIGGEGVPAALVTVLKNEGTPDDIRGVAFVALSSYRGNVEDEVAFAAEQGAVEGRIMALKLLADKRAQSKVDVVMEAAKDSNKEVSAAAQKGLASVVGPNQLFRLYAMLESAQDMQTINDLQVAIINASAMQDADTRFKDIVDQMNKSSNKALYYSILSATGHPDAFSLLVDGFNKGEDEAEQALFAIINFKGDQAMDKLYEIAKENKGSEYPMLATGAYILRISGSDMKPQMKVMCYRDLMNGFSKDDMRSQIILATLPKAPCFQSLIYAGEYLDSKDAKTRQMAVDAVRTIALGNKNYYGPVVVSLLNKAAEVNTGADKDYQRQEIEKHIASLPSEGGYVSMFNGRDLSGWKGLVENPITRAKMNPAELAKKQVAADEAMRRDWEVKDGLMVFTGKGFDNICSEKQYGDFEMYIDWLLYPDSDEADAGIYLRGTPQVQMWDTSRRNVGAQVGSGGLYNNSVNESTPSKVADNQLGRWNTFYIKMVGERVTVVLNGEKVVDNVILENFWDRKLPIPSVEQIELQAHGTRVAYRNIYINELKRTEPFVLSDDEKNDGFKVLFDGTTMNEWTGNTSDYVTQDGTIVLYPSNGHGGNLYTKDQYGDFVYRFEFMLTPGANNGLGIRTPLEGDAAYVGMELQILDDDASIYSQLEPYQYHGSVYGIIAAKRGALKPMGEWNYEEVYVKGDDIKITLNGVVIVDGNLAEVTKNGTADHKDHPGLKNKTGHIAFLGHGSEVRFRNIRVKELK